MATPSISHESFAWDYDVFLSFRGEDTRKNFTDHLYHALHQAGIRTFRDEEELRKGEYLAPELVKAIQSSRIAVIVFSKDYASSRWCLDELVEIVELKEKGKLKVFPIFYNVDPSEVRKQSGNYGIALENHKDRFKGSDKVQKWRDALTKVADMSGWDLQGMTNGYESKFINSIIKEVQLIVSRVPMFVAKHRVGLDSRVERVVKLLHGESNDGVRMVGIYGMGGIGKTTLAKAVYNRLFVHFESCCFLEIDSAISGKEDNGINLQEVDNQIKKIQKQLFMKLFNEEINIGSIDEGIMLMKRRLQAKKCLIVIDNLEHRNQFNKLCGGRDWFGEGSRLILTTREAHIFKELKVDECYEAKVFEHKESLKLFSLHAFKQPSLTIEDFDEVLDGIVANCGGLPLALEVLGSYLYDKSREEWISAFEKLKEIPNNDVQAKLKISYDGLPNDRTKSAFLDLVCFSHGCNEETFYSMGNFSNIEIRDLIDRCLINKGGWNNSEIRMHALIRKMGRELIRLESPNNPDERSRLWWFKDIYDVLLGQKGTEKIEMIVLNSPMKNMEYKYNTEAFKDMKNLRYLQIDGIRLEGNFKHLPCKSLRCLQWNHCPLEYIPSGCFFEKLVKLKMRESNIKEFGVPLKYFQCLESLDLARCKHLTRTPDFNGAKNLRILSFWECSSLEKVHSSIGDLMMLVVLDLRYCKRLKKIPKKLWQLGSVEDLSSSSVCYSSKIKELTQNSGNLTSLQTLYLDGTNIRSACFPSKSIQNDHIKLIQQFPPNLKDIRLANFKNLEVVSTLPTCLERIVLNGCTNLKMLPQLPQNLQHLSARNCESLETVHLPKKLEYVDLNNCKKLKEIQGLENAQFLRKINLRGVPNIKFRENINQILKGFKLDSKIHFRAIVSNNETLSWIKCEEKGGSSSISFQWPPLISNLLEFLGICISVELEISSCKFHAYYSTIEKDGFKVCRTQDYYVNRNGNVSIVDFISWGSFKLDIKAGEIIKVISNIGVKTSMVKKIRVEALYRDREDDFLQFLPLTKLDSNTEEEEEEKGLLKPT